MQIFLSGPIANCPNNNKEAFQLAAEKLRSMGHEVFSPIEIDGSDIKPRAALMRACIEALLKLHDGAVVFLPHWALSVGSCLEFRIANELNLRILMWPEGLDKPDGLEVENGHEVCPAEL